MADRIGLFGGTFDPVHFGHLRSALELRQHYQLDRVHMLPNHRPAHRDVPHASSEQRIAMLELACRSVSGLVVDAREAQRDTPSYTVDTLAELRADQADATLVFFLGQDSFSGFERWHRWEAILDLCHLVVIDRPDSELSDWSQRLLASRLESHGSDLSARQFGCIVRQSVTQLAISATRLRTDVASGRTIRFLLPDQVREYIDDNGLYR